MDGRSYEERLRCLNLWSHELKNETGFYRGFWDLQNGITGIKVQELLTLDDKNNRNIVTKLLLIEGERRANVCI